MVLFMYFLSFFFFKAAYFHEFKQNPSSFNIACSLYKYRYNEFLSDPDKKENLPAALLRQVVFPVLKNHGKTIQNCHNIADLTISTFVAYAKLLDKKNGSAYEVEIDKYLLKSENHNLDFDKNIYIHEEDFWYFSIITGTTTGHGDISPLSEKARRLAMLQVLMTTFIIGLIFTTIGIHAKKSKHLS